jgi:hypothetical protein
MEAGCFTIGGGVGGSPDGFKSSFQGQAGEEILSAFKKHVLEEMRRSSSSGRFVTAADADVDHHLGAVVMWHGYADDA